LTIGHHWPGVAEFYVPRSDGPAVSGWGGEGLQREGIDNKMPAEVLGARALNLR